MFFFLSKTLSYITMPLVIVCVCLITALICRNKNLKKKLFRLSAILLLFFSNDFIANEVTLWWEIPPTPFVELKKKYEYGILLTGVGKSEIQPADRVYFSRGADRVTHTLQLYKLGIIKKILVSGGNGKLKEVAKQEADEIAATSLRPSRTALLYAKSNEFGREIPATPLPRRHPPPRPSS